MKKRSGFFGVIANPQTYLNMVFLLLSFVLGIFYFVVLVTGISLGIGLFITWLGVPILVGMLFVIAGFASFERKTISIFLDERIRHNSIKHSKRTTHFQRLKAHLKDSRTWKSLAYLFIKFPLGIVSFVVIVTLLSVSLSLVSTPVLYYLTDIGVIQGDFCITDNSICFIQSYTAASIVGIVGIFSLFAFLHVFNGLAYLSGLLAKSLLGSKK